MIDLRKRAKNRKKLSCHRHKGDHFILEERERERERGRKRERMSERERDKERQTQ